MNGFFFQNRAFDIIICIIKAFSYRLQLEITHVCVSAWDIVTPLCH